MILNSQTTISTEDLNANGWFKRDCGYIDEIRKFESENHRLRQKIYSYEIKNKKLRASCDKLYRTVQAMTNWDMSYHVHTTYPLVWADPIIHNTNPFYADPFTCGGGNGI